MDATDVPIEHRSNRLVHEFMDAGDDYVLACGEHQAVHQASLRDPALCGAAGSAKRVKLDAWRRYVALGRDIADFGFAAAVDEAKAKVMARAADAEQAAVRRSLGLDVPQPEPIGA